MYLLVITLVTIILSSSIQGNTLYLKHNQEPVVVLELYTSQGCNSCPPAEQWLSQFVASELLWRELFPINFHVDYWDHLGWKDLFAMHAFSQRQRIYYKQGLVQHIATPGFVINGLGWEGWFNGLQLPAPKSSYTTPLEVSINLKQQILSFLTSLPSDTTVNIAILGFGIKSNITRGENKGRTFVHDFVVIGYKNLKPGALKNDSQLSTGFPATLGVSTTKKAIVIWLSDSKSIAPIQIVATWLQT